MQKKDVKQLQPAAKHHIVIKSGFMCIYISDDSNGSAVKHSRDSFQRASLSWNCDSRNPRQVLHTNCWGGQFENVVCWKYCSLLVAWSVPQQVTTTSWVDSGDIWTWKLAPVIVTWFLMINSRSLQTHDLIEPQTRKCSELWACTSLFPSKSQGLMSRRCHGDNMRQLWTQQAGRPHNRS